MPYYQNVKDKYWLNYEPCLFCLISLFILMLKDLGWQMTPVIPAVWCWPSWRYRSRKVFTYDKSI